MSRRTIVLPSLFVHLILEYVRVSCRREEHVYTWCSRDEELESELRTAAKTVVSSASKSSSLIIHQVLFQHHSVSPQILRSKHLCCGRSLPNPITLASVRTHQLQVQHDLCEQPRTPRLSHTSSYICPSWASLGCDFSFSTHKHRYTLIFQAHTSRTHIRKPNHVDCRSSPSDAGLQGELPTLGKVNWKSPHDLLHFFSALNHLTDMVLSP